MPARAMLPKDRWRALSTTGKVALVSGTSIVLVAGGGGVLAAWSQSASLVSGTLSTGNVTSSFTNTGTNQWTTPVANLVPADYLYRYLQIQNTGNVTQNFTLAVAGQTDWATDTALQITVSRCSAAWTQVSNSCGGTTTSVVAKQSVSAGGSAFTAGTGVTASGYIYLQVKLEIDSAAAATSQGKSGTVTLTETGSQLGGADRS